MSVYTHISETDLEAFIAQYAIGELQSYEGISAGIENTNYFVDTTQGRYVLTLFEHHTTKELSYFFDLMSVLAAANVPIAKPIVQKTGEILSTLNGKPASLVTRLNGSTLDKQQANLKQCQAIGDALAKMHVAARDFPQQRTPDRGVQWRSVMGKQLLEQCPLNTTDKQLLSKELAYQAEISFDVLPSGVIHADLFRDNSMFDGDELSGIIDLYYACNDSFLFDITVVVNDWCNDSTGELNEQKLSAFLDAYEAIRPLEDSEKTYWFAMLKAAALRFWLSRLMDKINPREGELTQLKDPDEFKSKLQSLIASQTRIESYWNDEKLQKRQEMPERKCVSYG